MFLRKKNNNKQKKKYLRKRRETRSAGQAGRMENRKFGKSTLEHFVYNKNRIARVGGRKKNSRLFKNKNWHQQKGLFFVLSNGGRRGHWKTLPLSLSLSLSLSLVLKERNEKWRTIFEGSTAVLSDSLFLCKTIRLCATTTTRPTTRETTTASSSLKKAKRKSSFSFFCVQSIHVSRVREIWKWRVGIFFSLWFFLFFFVLF